MNGKPTCKTCEFMNRCLDTDTKNNDGVSFGMCKDHMVMMRIDSYCVNYTNRVPEMLKPAKDILDSNRSDKNKLVMLSGLITRNSYDLIFEQEQEVLNYIFSRIVIK